MMEHTTTQHKNFNLIYWGLIASIFIISDILWNLYSGRSALYDSLMIPWLRVTVVSVGLLVFLLFLALLAFLLHRLAAIPAANNRKTADITAFIIFSLLIFLYTASWLSFHYTGIFLNVDIFRMLFNDPVQLMQHVTHISPLSLGFAVVVTLLVSGLLTYKLKKFSHKLASRHYTLTRNTLLAGALVIGIGAISSVMFFSLSSGKITDPNTGIAYTPLERFNETVAQRTGPIISVAWGLKSSLEPILLGTESSSNNERVVSRDIIPMNKYLEDSKPKKKKNVIVLLVESLRSDQLPVYGGSENVMPTLQDIAAQSIVYTNAYATSSHSNYSDLAPLSSHYPLRSINVHYYPKEPSYPRVLLHDILKPLGYKTAIISSQNEHWGNMLNYLDTGNVDYILHAENYDGILRKSLSNNSSADDPLMGDKKQGKIDDKFTINEAIKWIDSQKEQPFMLYMNLQSSHFPYDVSDKYLQDEKYNKPKLPKFIGPNLDIQDKDGFKKAYQDSLRYIDMHISRFIDYLKQESLWQDTILVVSADTATAFFEHGQWGNGGPLYDEVVKVPLFIYNADYEHKINNWLTSHVDVMPTLVDMLGLPPHPSFQGTSTLTAGNPQHENRPVFLVCQSPAGYQYAVVQDNWKLIFDGTQARKILYRLDGDNPEKYDFSSEKPELNNKLTNLLFTWMNTQIDYYQQKNWHRKQYPPVINGYQ
ncbi:MAG: sulfatase [Thioalkalispiraceae bacterium]|jgi:arylsulfatase